MSYYIYIFFTLLQKIPGITLYQLVMLNDNCVIVMVPKCGTRSIRDALLHVKLGKKNQYLSASKKNLITAPFYKFVTLSKLKKIAQTKSVYVIHREWNDRIKSCWRQKIDRQESYFYFWQYYPFLRPGMSFSSFEKRVKSMPERFREKHFMSYADLYSIPELKRIDLGSLDNFLNDKFGVSYISNTTNA
jgi:hypothetical protein